MLRKTILALAIAACGRDAPAPAPAPAPEHHEMEMANMPPELARFHDVLAPRWHAAKGAQRTADTCNALGEFRAKLAAVANAPAPAATSADAWTSGGKRLGDAIDALAAACATSDAAKFETAFEQVHERFHDLLDTIGGHHEHGA